MHLSKYEMKNWHGLPALRVNQTNGISYWAFFTNINNEIVVGRFPLTEFDNEIYYQIAKREGAFLCFDNLDNKIKETMTLVLCLTDKCNCRCKYCFLDADNIGHSMSFELLHKAIDKGIELAEARHLIIAAFGGEPGLEQELLHEMVTYSKEMIQKSKVKSYEFRITTNGIISDNIINIINDNNFITNISMDGTESIQNFQRPFADGSTTYAIVEDTIKKLIQKKKADITIRCTVTKYSVKEIPNIIKSLAKLSIKKIHFEPVTQGGRAANVEEKLQPPSPEDFIKYLEEGINIAANLNVDILSFPYMNMHMAPYIFCDGNVNNRLVVSAEGNLSTCVEVQSQAHILFNGLGVGYYDATKGEFIITNSRRRSVCRNSCTSTNIKIKCNDCPLKFYCGGGCPTRNYRGTNNTEIIDEYRCKIVQNLIPFVLSKIYYETYTL